MEGRCGMRKEKGVTAFPAGADTGEEQRCWLLRVSARLLLRGQCPLAVSCEHLCTRTPLLIPFRKLPVLLASGSGPPCLTGDMPSSGPLW